MPKKDKGKKASTRGEARSAEETQQISAGLKKLTEYIESPLPEARLYLFNKALNKEKANLEILIPLKRSPSVKKAKIQTVAGTLLFRAIEYLGTEARKIYDPEGHHPIAATILIRTLLEAGANPNTPGESYDPKDKANTLVQITSPFECLICYCTAEKKDSVRRPLYEAAISVFFEYTQYPLEYNRNFHLFTIAGLLQRNILAALAGTNNTPEVALTEQLQKTAAEKGWPLLNPDIQKKGITSLAFAATEGHENTVEWLLQTLHADVNAILENTENFSSALHIACSSILEKVTPEQNQAVIRMLCRYGASLTCTNAAGETPLHLACGHLARVAVRVLAEEHPDFAIVANQLDSKGHSPLDWAREQGGDPEILALLESKEAALPGTNFPVKILIAINTKNVPLLTAQLTNPACTDEHLIHHLYDAHEADVNLTSFSYAIESSCFEMALLLLNRCRSVACIKRSDGRSPLSSLLLKAKAIRRLSEAYLPLLERLLNIIREDAPDELDDRNDSPNLPLVLSLLSSHPIVVQAFLSAGAKPWIGTKFAAESNAFIFALCELPEEQCCMMLPMLLESLERHPQATEQIKTEVILLAVVYILYTKKTKLLGLFLERALPYLRADKKNINWLLNRAIRLKEVDLLSTLLASLKTNEISVEDLPSAEEMLIRSPLCYLFMTDDTFPKTVKTDMTETFLKAGVNPNTFVCVIHMQDQQNTLMGKITISALLCAVLYGLDGCVQALLSKKILIDDRVIVDGRLPKEYINADELSSRRLAFLSIVEQLAASSAPSLVLALHLSIIADNQNTTADLSPHFSIIESLLAYNPAWIHANFHSYTPLSFVETFASPLFRQRFTALVLTHCRHELEPTVFHAMQQSISTLPPMEDSTSDTRAVTALRYFTENDMLPLLKAFSQTQEPSPTSPSRVPGTTFASAATAKTIYSFAQGLLKISPESPYIIQIRNRAHYWVLVTPGIISWLMSEGCPDSIRDKIKKKQCLDKFILEAQGENGIALLNKKKSPQTIVSFEGTASACANEPVAASFKYKLVREDARIYFVPFKEDDNETTLLVPLADFTHEDVVEERALNFHFLSGENGGFGLEGAGESFHLIFPPDLHVPKPTVPISADGAGPASLYDKGSDSDTDSADAPAGAFSSPS